MKAKNIIYIGGRLFALCVLCALTACSDFLEIKSREEILLEDFWNEKADVDNIVAGCYSGMQADNVITRMIVWGEARSENMMVGPHDPMDGDLENVLKENIKTKNFYTTWDGFYTVINRCNTVLKYAPGVAERDPGYTQSELQATIAEVSALRDLCYFYLIRTFRDVPFTTQAYIDDNQKMDVEPTPFYDVLDSLITDLEKVQGYAMKRYPSTKTAYQTCRITKSAIWAMLCELYLWKGDYQSSIHYADLVIEDKKDLVKERLSQGVGGTFEKSSNESRFNGYPLISYTSAYDKIFSTGSSQETIFELLFDKSDPGYSRLGNSAVGRLYGSVDFTPYIVPSNTVSEDGFDKTTQRVIYADRNKFRDARISWNTEFDTKYICKYAYGSVAYVSSTSSNYTSLGANKYRYNKENNVDHFRNSSPWIIYRLTDIMLLKAEALCQQLHEGSESDVLEYNAPILDEIFSLVNAVNKRAVAQTTLVDTLLASNYRTKATAEALVMKERQRELMFEGKRWFDLVRYAMRAGNTEVVCDAIRLREGINSQYVLNTFRSSTTGMYAIFWPYNDEETKVNPNLAKHQNPAFDSGESNISK